MYVTPWLLEREIPLSGNILIVWNRATLILIYFYGYIRIHLIPLRGIAVASNSTSEEMTKF
jgi:hypothetical protein